MNIVFKLPALKHFLLKLFFPKECLGCNQSDTWLCQECLHNISIRSISPAVHIRHQDYIDKVLVVSFYANDILRKLIDLYKYHYLEDLRLPLGTILAKYVSHNNLKSVISSFVLLPIPLHHRRFLERGFNQSELLAIEFARKVSLPILTDCLMRTRYTKHQTLLNQNQRASNVKDVFSVKDQMSIIGKQIILIDDVVTTGASLNEAARVLRRAGAVKVWALVLAKN